jgi:hypothetical protein
MVAKRVLGDVVKGADPASDKALKRNAAAVRDLCDVYLADADAGRLLTRSRTPKKQSALAIDRGRIERHIKPVLGALPVSAVTREDVNAFMHAVAEGRTAGRTKTAKKRGLARIREGAAAGDGARRVRIDTQAQKLIAVPRSISQESTRLASTPWGTSSFDAAWRKLPCSTTAKTYLR